MRPFDEPGMEHDVATLLSPGNCYARLPNAPALKS
jgi:hypothetical protein